MLLYYIDKYKTLTSKVDTYALTL